MPNVSKEFFLEDRNPSNWTLVVTEPVGEEEVATVVAVNKITGTEFIGTVAEFNEYLAIGLGDAYEPDNVYDLTTGVLSGDSQTNAVVFEDNPVTGNITTIYKCNQAEYDAIVTKDAETLYVIVGD